MRPLRLPALVTLSALAFVAPACRATSPVPPASPASAITAHCARLAGVTQTEMMPIYHQFRRPYPGDGAGMGVGFLSTPRWPSHTDQFGVYYVRGPWK